MKEFYDLVIIGGGPAGYRAAEKAKKHFKTALFESKNPGGVCLNEGCVPTKTLLHIVKDIAAAKTLGGYGFTLSGAPDLNKISRQKDRVIKILRAGVRESINGVDYFNEKAVIEGVSDGKFVVAGENVTVLADKLLIATGSSAAVPPVAGLREALDAGAAVTNAGALEITSIPQRFVIIGGGVIGVEMAAIYSALGSSVTIVEATDKLLPQMDTELGKYIGKAFAGNGIRIYTSAKAERILASEDGNRLIIDTAEGQKEIIFDKLLVATGRRPNTAGIGLENIGVKIERGIVTDEYMRTSVPKVWASGDVNGKMMLAHKAYREADAAVSDMLGQPVKVRYDSIPEAVYTLPEVASVGAKEGDVPGAEVRKIPASFSARYVAESASRDGFIKTVSLNGRLIGIQLAVPYATEIVSSAAMMIELGMTADEVGKLCFPHPSVSELLLI